jgi:hypothetical protein
MLIGSQANATVCSSTIPMPIGDGGEPFSAFSFSGTDNHNITYTYTYTFVSGHTYTGFGCDVAPISPATPIITLLVTCRLYPNKGRADNAEGDHDACRHRRLDWILSRRRICLWH